MAIIAHTLNKLGVCPALIPFITVGVPNLSSTREALQILDDEGADIIELGLPYSDPLADGPIIQEASKIALHEGANLDSILLLISEMSTKIKAPLILFTYYNPILSRGIDRFLSDITNAGIKGLIVPDLPLEETDYLLEQCDKKQLELILLVTPTSSEKRISQILNKSRNIIYVVSTTGVTGLRNNLENNIYDFINKIKDQSNKLLILGFGISTSDHVNKVSQWSVDGIVMGSAFVKILIGKDGKLALKSLKLFCREIKQSLLMSINSLETSIID